MPTYSYACTACEHRFDTVQQFTDPSLTDCPECSGRLRKVFSAVGIVFKGSGFYRNDSRASSSVESSSNGKTEPGSNGKSQPEAKPSKSGSGSSFDSKSGSGSSSDSKSGSNSDSKSGSRPAASASTSSSPAPTAS